MTPKPVIVVSDERYARHLEGIFHLESPKRFFAFQSVLAHPSLNGRWVSIPPRPATQVELAWFHTPAYIQRVEQTAGHDLVSFDLDTQASAASYETACLAVGGVFALLDAIYAGEAERGFAALRPPGHHAEADQAMGFCLFNNVVLGARYLQERYGSRKILIVDIDAHHGNGIQNAFYDTPRVLYMSAHQFPAYPGTGKLGDVGQGAGEGYNINIPLGRGCGDRDFYRIIYHLIGPVAREYRPDIILVPCGFDLYMHDRLAAMAVSADGYAQIAALLLEIAAEVCHGRIAFIMEGGYSVKGIRECGLRLMQELCGVSTMNPKDIDKIKRAPLPRFSVLKKVIDIQKKYWKSLR